MQWKREDLWWTITLKSGDVATLHIANAPAKRPPQSSRAEWSLIYPRALQKEGDIECRVGDANVMGPDEAKVVALAMLQKRAREFYSDIEPFLR